MVKEEDNLLFNLYYQVGPKWSYLKKFFIGRSANSLKNRWTYFILHQENKTYIFNQILNWNTERKYITEDNNNNIFSNDTKIEDKMKNEKMK